MELIRDDNSVSPPVLVEILPLDVYTFFLYKQPVYKQPVLRSLKNVATFEAQKSPVA